MDRDGTINVDKGYTYKVEDLIFIDGAIEFIKCANDLGYLTIVVSNQAGIARGYYTIEDAVRFNDYMNIELSKYRARIDKFYICPHHTEGTVEGLNITCECRKPKTGMLDKAVADFNISLDSSFMFGNKKSDIECGEKKNIKSFLVNKKRTLKYYIDLLKKQTGEII